MRHLRPNALLPFIILAAVFFATPAKSALTDRSSLPMLPDGVAQESADWLIDGSTFEARVCRTGRPDEIALDNGLIRRTFRLGPNAATVAFDHLVTDQALIRGVKPEARVTIDGVAYDVGGLTGQPNYAYLLPEWLDRLRADEGAFRFIGFEAGKPRERFAWKRVRHHAPSAQWPPSGVYLRMDYTMPAAAQSAAEPLASDAGRTCLLRDDFSTLDNAWRVHASPVNLRSSFQNEGKVGEIYTPMNTAVFAERPLAAGTRLVEATIDPGTDRAGSWGPGIALVWADRTIKFNLRPGGNATESTATFGVFDGRGENPQVGGKAKLDIGKPWTLRLCVVDSAVHCEARQGGGPWKTYHTVKVATPLGDPRLVRVGKMDLRGGGSDFQVPGDIGRLRIIGVAAYGGQDEAALAPAGEATSHKDSLGVSVHYELYDGIPCMSKWMTVHNATDRRITVDRFTSEILAAVEHGSAVEFRGLTWQTPNIHVETDMAFGGFTHGNANRQAIHWVRDPQYHTQVNYQRVTPCLLEVKPTYGPAQSVEPGATFESFRAFILPQDSTDRERQGLALRRMYRTIAPWVTENPLMMHMRTARPDAVRAAIDQCADVGFEMLILSFGSGFNIENESPAYLAQWRSTAEYAASKSIEIGGYSLLSSRRVGGGNAIVSPKGQRPTHGNCPALTSAWGQDYFRKLYQFFEKTGFTLLEHDGSYPGDVDVTPRLPLQKGEHDSQWAQWRIIGDFYKWCRGKGVYLNVPDYYYLAGSSKCGMGYREVNWSLPRAQQVIHTRQNIFDGTWEKTPSMGWMFVPLTQYHGGGAAATIEPLDTHLDHYERMITSNLAMGVQACYRGPRLYDTERTKDTVKRWVDWFKAYRDILESDVVHGRRPDGRDLDWMLHVNPELQRKGMLVVFNPLPQRVAKTIAVDLYYTGLTEQARVSERGEDPVAFELGRDYRVCLPVQVEPQGMNWYIIE